MSLPNIIKKDQGLVGTNSGRNFNPMSSEREDQEMFEKELDIMNKIIKFDMHDQSLDDIG